MKCRKIMAVVLALILMFSVTGCKRGNIENVQITIGESALYSEEELQTAVKTVLKFFAREFAHCTLEKLEYNEEKSLREAASWAAQYEAEEAIVLNSSFDVDADYGTGPLNPGETCKYTWILVRSNGGKWELKTWGY